MQKFYLKIPMIFAILFSMTLFGQKDYTGIIQHYLERNNSSLGLNSNDFSDLVIYDQYYTESMELMNVYAIQQINDVPVFNGIGNFAVKNGEVVYFANSFQRNIEKRTNDQRPKLTPAEALSEAANQLGLERPENIKILSAESSQEFLLSPSGISQREIPVKLVYQPVSEENIRLAWDMNIHTIDGEHLWSVRVDALTGEIIAKDDWVVRCSFPAESHDARTIGNAGTPSTGFGKAPSSFLSDGSQYNVFELPLESPNHGGRSIVSEPSDVTASPYGWHDVDGVTGPEFTITRGNNVYAFENREGDFFQTGNEGYSPDGGTNLDFDFPLDLNNDPSNYIDGAVTNLFYMNNMMHDIWYQYGFNEASGNFQQTNYTTFGSGNDPVIALAQAGANSGPGNNAVFIPTPDGINSFMLMFTWGAAGPPQYLTVNTTGNLSGSYTAETAEFGNPLSNSIPITADLVLMEDDNSGVSTDIYDGCDVVTNGAQISGKIAVIRRGECSFSSKVLKAQNEGALAAIIVNDVASSPIPMGGTDPLITIPSIMLSMADGTPIINALISGDVINVSLMQFGPFQKDGDLDNSVIAHEYGHGISSRLTGGPSQAGCLQNNEQMGEGWSDFFGLVLTMKAGDQGTDSRGYGTYVENQPVTGSGIRLYPYSTNLSVNPYTYADVQDQYYFDQGVEQTHVHGVGSIWGAILWDMTWALIDQYGFDADVYNGTGGNNIAMQLVIDGLKVQPCGPGFVDGRDAILTADQTSNNGANQCLIWEVFARRGVGYSASQGSSDDIHDQVVAYDMPPASILECNAGTSDFGSNFFQIYPNPTNGLVNITSSRIKGELQINLFDMNGRKVLGKKVDMTGDASIDTAQLSNGIYIMQLTSEGKTQTEKLIVQ